MAFKVGYHGVTIECDTAQEALDIARQLADIAPQAETQTSANTAASDGRITASRIKEFVGFLDAKQKRFLSVLLENPHGKTDQALRQTFGFEGNQQLGGFVSGIAKWAKKSGFGMESVVTIERVRIGDADAKEYKLHPAFRKVALESGELKI